MKYETKIVLLWLLGLILAFIILGVDNPFEETTEEILKSQTGIQIDLSPGSPE